jgi:hypothetical protein
MRKLLVLAGLAAVAAAVAKKVKDQQAQPVWHTPDTDPDPGTGAGPAAAADDAAGASPDEALADSVEEPHVATTPDAPLQEDEIPPTA